MARILGHKKTELPSNVFLDVFSGKMPISIYNDFFSWIFKASEELWSQTILEERRDGEVGGILLNLQS